MLNLALPLPCLTTNTRLKFDQMAQLANVEWQTLCKVAFILAAVTDVLISLVMMFFLHERKTGFQKTTDLVNRLVRLVF
jgi:signal transduction histidine kinase